MYDLIVKLTVAAALLQLGISVLDFKNCHSRECVEVLEKKSRDVLRVDWKSISIWPEEAF